MPAEDAPGLDGDRATGTALVQTPIMTASRRLALLGSLTATLVVFDQATKAIVRAMLPALRERGCHPRVLEPDARAKHRCGLRRSEWCRVSLQDDPPDADFARGAHRDRRLRYKNDRASTGGPDRTCTRRRWRRRKPGRSSYGGHVVDFVDVYWRSWHFWAFNAAMPASQSARRYWSST